MKTPPRNQAKKRKCTSRSVAAASSSRNSYSVSRVARRLRISRKDAAFLFSGEPGVVRGKSCGLRIPEEVFARVHQRLNDLTVLVKILTPAQLRRWWREERRTGVCMLGPVI